MLTVIAPNTKRDLTKLATVKAEMGITDRDSDAKLKVLITQASGIVAEYCNRVFAIETVSETFRRGHHSSQPFSFPAVHHRGNHELVLHRYPVTEIVSVTENDTLLDSTMYELNPTEGTLLRLCSDQYSHWASGKTTVVYSAGFTLPDGLPAGVERATIMLVKQFALSGDRDPMVRAETSDGVGSTNFFSGDGTGLSPEIAGLLEQHRSPNLG
jgi:hypothetical protein